LTASQAQAELRAMICGGRGIARELLIALMLVVVVLTGFSRGVVSAADAAAWTGGHFAGPICHAQSSNKSDPTGREVPASHDCCDECALLAPAALPGAAEISEPARIASVEARTTASWSFSDSLKTRSPRQAQAPPGTLIV